MAVRHGVRRKAIVQVWEMGSTVPLRSRLFLRICRASCKEVWHTHLSHEATFLSAWACTRIRGRMYIYMYRSAPVASQCGVYKAAKATSSETRTSEVHTSPTKASRRVTGAVL